MPIHWAALVCSANIADNATIIGTWPIASTFRIHDGADEGRRQHHGSAAAIERPANKAKDNTNSTTPATHEELRLISHRQIGMAYEEQIRPFRICPFLDGRPHQGNGDAPAQDIQGRQAEDVRLQTGRREIGRYSEKNEDNPSDEKARTGVRRHQTKTPAPPPQPAWSLATRGKTP